jgi:hypothetical protein
MTLNFATSVWIAAFLIGTLMFASERIQSQGPLVAA